MTKPLFHFAEKPVTLESRAYSQERDSKPKGFWLSVEDGWAEWCTSEDFSLPRLAVRHAVNLDWSRILVLDSAKKIDAFTQQYGCDPYGINRYVAGRAIDWPAVAAEYQGIVIAPYCWERRMSNHTFWYYSWDCASGCVWDLSAITSMELLESAVATHQQERAK